MARQVRAGTGHLRHHGPRAGRSRGGARQRRRAGHGGLGAQPSGRCGSRRGQRLLPPQPYQRCLVPRPRPHLPPALAGRPPRAGDRRLGLQRVGRQVPAVRPGRCDPRPDRGRAGASRVRARDRDGRRLDRRERPRHLAHHRGLSPQPEPQSAARPRRHRAVPARLPGCHQDPLAGRRHRG